MNEHGEHSQDKLAQREKPRVWYGSSGKGDIFRKAGETPRSYVRSKGSRSAFVVYLASSFSSFFLNPVLTVLLAHSHPHSHLSLSHYPNPNCFHIHIHHICSGVISSAASVPMTETEGVGSGSGILLPSSPYSIDFHDADVSAGTFLVRL